MPQVNVAAFAAGQVVTIRAGGPTIYRKFEGVPCSIRRIETATNIEVAELVVEDGPLKGHELPDVCTAFLSPLPPEKAPRRGVLHLHAPEDDRTEAEKQKEGVSFLQKLGYKVLVSGQYLKKVQCTAEGCGHWFWPQGFGNSVGYPDISLTHSQRWPRCVWALIEYKKDENAPRSPAQIALAEEGRTVFVWSLDMLVDAVLGVEAAMGVEPHPGLLTWKEQKMGGRHAAGD